jgi:hypothetical protein
MVHSFYFYKEITNPLILLLLQISGILTYFIPSIVAVMRKHNNRNPIIVLNFFLGWTFFGWVIALVWALTDNVRK